MTLKKKDTEFLNICKKINSSLKEESITVICNLVELDFNCENLKAIIREIMSNKKF